MKHLTIFFLLLATVAYGQQTAIVSPDDRRVFDAYIEYIEPWSDGADEVILEKTAAFFLDRPYVAHTLEGGEVEALVVNLRKFDCFTFVETVTALAAAVKEGEPTIAAFTDNLEKIRYRGGVIEGYSSRLHYTVDWLHDNKKLGYYRNISSEIGGVNEDKTINFMSAHRSAYKHLKDDDEMLDKIILIEDEINSRGGFSYLPKQNIKAMEQMIPHMSVVAFATSIEGLDVTHVGFAFRKDGELTFIHASSVLNKVVIDEKSLNDYCESQRSCTGIVVAEVF